MRFWPCLLALLGASTTTFADTSITLSIPPLIREGVLRVGYDIQCANNKTPILQALVARFKDQSETFRIPIFRHLRTFEFPVTHSRDARDLGINPVLSAGCFFRIGSSELVYSESLLLDRSPEIQAKIHSPVLVPRWDQRRNLWNDVPVRLYYSIVPDSNRSARIIRYTAVFTDEDSLPNPQALRRQMASYGRRLDIEWVYEVHLDDATGRVIGRYYQGDQAIGIGHSRRTFQGSFFQNSLHPILYTVARHNVFSDRPQTPYGWNSKHRVFLPLSSEIRAPAARENVLLSEPWLVQASDEELTRRFRHVPAATHHFFVRVQGTSSSLPLRATLVWEGVSRPLAAPLKKLGQDLFENEAWIAFQLTPGEMIELRGKPWQIHWQNKKGETLEGPRPLFGYRLYVDAEGIYRWESHPVVASTAIKDRVELFMSARAQSLDIPPKR